MPLGKEFYEVRETDQQSNTRICSLEPGGCSRCVIANSRKMIWKLSLPLKIDSKKMIRFFFPKKKFPFVLYAEAERDRLRPYRNNYPENSLANHQEKVIE